MDLDQARLLVAKADNDLQSAFASLSTVLGERQAESFDLAEEPMPELVTNSATELILEALGTGPTWPAPVTSATPPRNSRARKTS